MKLLPPAETYIKAWVTHAPLPNPSAIPTVQGNLNEIYSTHDSMIHQATSSPYEGYYKGLAGWKMGAVGILPNVPCLSGPLFNRFVQHECSDSVLDVTSAYGGTTTHTLEGEVGFVMKEDVNPTSGGDLSIEDVWDCVDFILPCIEVCGNRFSEALLVSGKVPIADKLADGLMCAGVICGLPVSKTRVESNFGGNYEKVDERLKSIVGSLLVNGKLINEGTGVNCPERGPLASLAWLANHLVKRGTCLKKGEIIISGAICKTSAFPVGAARPDEVLVDFGPFLGKVGVKIVRGKVGASKL